MNLSENPVQIIELEPDFETESSEFWKTARIVGQNEIVGHQNLERNIIYYCYYNCC